MNELLADYTWHMQQIMIGINRATLYTATEIAVLLGEKAEYVEWVLAHVRREL